MIKNRTIKLLICDIDGTLAIKGGDLMPLTRKALEEFHARGTLLGLGTGRPVDKRTIGKFKDWGLDFDPDLVIGLNGCEIWYRKDNRKERYMLLEKEEVRKILDFMWDLDVNVSVFEDGYDKVLARRKDWMIEESMNRNRSNVEFVGKERFCQNDVCKLEFHYDEKIEDQIFERIAQHPTDRYVFTKTFTGTLEFMKPGVDKGVALEIACKEFGISLEETIACGDMDNDIPMLQKAGIGICLANGSDNTKKAADYVTEHDVYHDGLGDFFYRHHFK